MFRNQKDLRGWKTCLMNATFNASPFMCIYSFYISVYEQHKTKATFFLMKRALSESNTFVIRKTRNPKHCSKATYDSLLIINLSIKSASVLECVEKNFLVTQIPENIFKT